MWQALNTDATYVRQARKKQPSFKELQRLNECKTLKELDHKALKPLDKKVLYREQY